MTKFFETKDQYLNFITFWKNFHKEGKHLCKTTERVQYNYDLRKDITTYHRESELTAGHHIVYMVALGRDLEKSIGNAKPETYTKLLNIFTYSPSITNMFEDILSEDQKILIVERVRKWLSDRLTEIS